MIAPIISYPRVGIDLSKRSKRRIMSTTIQHYHDLGDFKYGTCDQVTPHVRRVICKNPTLLVGDGMVI